MLPPLPLSKPKNAGLLSLGLRNPYDWCWFGQTLTRWVLCEGQERPCTRCIKRNIGHLCHDEPRDHDSRKSKSAIAPSTVQDAASQPDLARSAMNSNTTGMRPGSFDAAALGNGPGQAAKAAFDAATLSSRSNNPLQLVQPSPVSGFSASALGTTLSQCMHLSLPRSLFSPKPRLCPWNVGQKSN